MQSPDTYRRQGRAARACPNRGKIPVNDKADGDNGAAGISFRGVDFGGRAPVHHSKGQLSTQRHMTEQRLRKRNLQPILPGVFFGAGNCLDGAGVPGVGAAAAAAADAPAAAGAAVGGGTVTLDRLWPYETCLLYTSPSPRD